MKNLKSKLNYFTRSLVKRSLNGHSSCPNCRQRASTIVDKKALVTSLVECSNCKLLFRTPTDSAPDNLNFYQADYAEDFTSECPSDEELLDLKNNNFVDVTPSYSTYLSVLKHLGYEAGAKIFDFGCSWGYGSYRLAQAGYDVEAYEISRPRCAYAVEKLGIRATSDLSAVGRDYDLFFSAHVLEHVPDPQATIELARKIVKPGGLFLAFTPNGSAAYRAKHWSLFHKAWGLTHPNYLQDAFYQHVFRTDSYLLTTDPYPFETLRAWNRREQVVCEMSGWELMAAVVL